MLYPNPNPPMLDAPKPKAVAKDVKDAGPKDLFN
jgi:hypothetical protein